MKLSHSEQAIVQGLLAQGLINQAQLDKLLQGDGQLFSKLLEENLLDEQQLCEALSKQYHIPVISLEAHIITEDLSTLLPAAPSLLMKVVPYKLQDDLLYVVTADPLDLHLESKLETLTGKNIKLLLATASQITDCLNRNEGSQQILQNETENFTSGTGKSAAEDLHGSVVLDSINPDTAPVIRLVNSILLAALQKRASDIHIETHDQGIDVKYRIDGVLYPATQALSVDYHSALISRLKVIAELDIAEKQMPQDGRFKTRIDSRDIDFRVSILPGIFGEDVVIRVLDKHAIVQGVQSLSLDNLGMSESVVKKFRRAINEPYGMVLMTGPTGSGKTTTLYAALTELNNGEEKIITIEDPVEYQLQGVVQVPVNEKKQLSFAQGLRSILRHDPDKIMVGEIRDKETAQIAVQSALTGHLVFTTVHANNSFDVIGRFSHMGVDVYSFISSLNCIVAQRLVRKLCESCKQQVNPSEQELEISGLDYEKYQQSVFYSACGCERCNNTGYHGRIAILELLKLTPELREMIINRQPVNKIHSLAKQQGMVSLREAAIEKVLQGMTSLKEINRVTFID